MLTRAEGPVGFLVELALRIVLALLLLAAVELIVARVAVACLVGGGEAGVEGNRLDLYREDQNL